MRYISHFTKMFSTLEQILETESLKLAYCTEEFHFEENVISKAAHPMISFSEYEIQTIDKRHITYGHYGIAFARRWILKNKIHPVLYINNSSLVAKSLATLLIARRSQTELTDEIKESIMMLKCFTKNSKGYNSHFEINDFNFRAENEWRYVPTKEQIDRNFISLPRNKYKENKEKYNNRLLDFPLKFTIQDVKYIFVHSEAERNSVHRRFSFPLESILLSRWSIFPKLKK